MGEQVVVVTGASAGVGRATVRAFAARGARIGLIARGRAGLEATAAEVAQAGGIPLVLPADVADPGQVDAAAARVEAELGPIDVWVNNAFAGVFAPFWQVTPEEYARTTEVTYLGTVNGTRAALARMRARDHGVIVQVGSALAYRSIPLQSAYCGAKHAIEGFTESLRTELRHSGSAVQVPMVQLPALNTPQFDWVLSRLPRRPQPVPPIYQPEVAARAIVRAADHPKRRERWVGASTAATVIAEKIVPGLLDRYLARTGYQSQQTGQTEPPDEPYNLWEPCDTDHDHGAHGRFDDQARPSGDRLGPRSTLVQGRRMVSWHRSPGRAAPSVVCVHGAGASSRELRPLVAELGRELDAWTVDLPGFGHSDKPDHPLDLRELADALADWLTVADVAPACLVGCSFGGQIAADLAVRRPELVSALVLAGPTIDPQGRSWPRFIGRWLRNSVHEDARMARLNIADYLDAGTRRVFATFRESMRDRIEDKLPQVTVPTLVVRGELDRLGPADWAEEVTRLLPHGRLVTVPGSPHMIPFKAPRELADHIASFVTDPKTGIVHVVG
ncbi:MAG TPA: SDR family oxidoreductase [Streptosporangiaceae bacterium]|jgi:NAD(P)-dependent dehydrogenase (short-subunit alcohol dehydrogenase family)/pimeloyl-ACP methyl ester carboxylesterase